MSGEFNPDQLNTFSAFRDFHAKIFIEKYKHWLKWNPKGKDTILDIGCSTGAQSHKLIYPIIPKDFSKFVYSDKCQLMLNEAKMHFGDDSKVSYEILDISSDLDDAIKAKMGSFDHIFSLYSLTWIADQRKCFERIYELLSPGGDCFLIFVAGSLYMEIVTELIGKARWKKFIVNPDEVYPFPHRKDPNPVKTVTEMMKSIGFVNINVKLEKSLFVFSTVDEFLGYLKGLPNPLQKMSQKEQEDYLKQAADLAIARNLIGEMSERKYNDTVSEIFVIYGRRD
ncbi:juvenile hormone acid O-methyltransferase-like [Phlebotomus papatasi]|uniref:Methyltransferase type 11 domain-containing protein n=1 Tax=Phlebotomus papatasi TaxID=29031 RepID=A0A1B0DPR8_PHLPP|nr:juvenile hormone acid O-methyltransferase-like [Phlebotomus papatasi]